MSEKKINTREDVKDLFLDFFKRGLVLNKITSNENEALTDFLANLQFKLGNGYSDLNLAINGKYAIFMQHGPWFNMLLELYRTDGLNSEGLNDIRHYISDLDKNKIKDPIFFGDDNLFRDTYNSKINLNQLITDIQIPEINKEYIAVSTRQKNSFINSRNYTGSDISLNWLDLDGFPIFRYHEAWHKMIDLIRDGRIYFPEEFKKYNSESYLIPNPYANAIYIPIMESHTMELKAVIAIYGIFPVNVPLKSLIGDRSSSKLVNYSINYKCMDIQYSFIDGWYNLANLDQKAHPMLKNFYNFLNIDTNVTPI